MKKIILLSGKMQSGKNASADIIFDYLNENKLSNKHLFFAKALKDECKEDFQLVKDYLNNFIGNIILKHPSIDFDLLKELNPLRLNDDNFYEDKTDLSRLLLQIYGTQIFRNRVDTNHWVDKVVDDINSSIEDFYIITDVRFLNEISHLEKNLTIDSEVIKIRVNRDIARGGVSDEHISETALDDYNGWDYLIENDSDLNELKNKTIEIIKEIEND